MYRLNAVLMVFLCVVVMGFAAVMAFHVGGADAKPTVDEQQVSRLLLKLTDDDPAERDRAEAQLAEMEKDVVPRIRAACNGAGNDLALRLRRILRAIEGPSAASPQP